jgi:hypothetical protein
MVMALAAPAWARIVKIETAVPQSDPSPETLERALKEALDIIVQGAAPWASALFASMGRGSSTTRSWSG